MDVALPPAAGPAFEALAPAIERLARARPLARRLTAEDLRPSDDGATDLFVASGELQAIVRSAPATGDADAAAATGRASNGSSRKPTADWRPFARRLADASFTSKAPAAIVDGARRQEAELSELADRLRDRLDH